MMDFISIPLVCGVVFTAIYGIFELFVRKSERIKIIEKLGELNPNVVEGKIRFPGFVNNFSFSALKAGALMAGVGLGLLVGFFINLGMLSNGNFTEEHWFRNEMMAVAYGASVLLFGGIGLLVAFALEMKINKKQTKE